MTSTRLGTPTWIAARPMPGASYIVSNMSAISARQRRRPKSSTGVEICAQQRVGNFDDGRRDMGAG